MAKQSSPSSDARLAAQVAIVVAVIGGLFGLANVFLGSAFDPSSPTGDEGADGSSPARATDKHEAPLTAAVIDGGVACLTEWMVPMTPEEAFTRSRSTPDNPTAWIMQSRGMLANEHEVEIILQGTSTDSVVIRELRVVVVGEREPPVEGTLLDFACGDARSYRYVEADLDRSPPTMKPKVEDPFDERRLEKIRFPYEIAADKSESFIVSARTSQYEVFWRIEIDWASRGQTGTLVLDNDGRNFHTSSSAATSATCALAGDGSFVADDVSSACRLD